MPSSSPAPMGDASGCGDLEAQRREHGPDEARAVSIECGDGLNEIADRLRWQLQRHGDLLPPAERLMLASVAGAAEALAPLLLSAEHEEGTAG